MAEEKLIEEWQSYEIWELTHVSAPVGGRNGQRSRLKTWQVRPKATNGQGAGLVANFSSLTEAREFVRTLAHA